MLEQLKSTRMEELVLRNKLELEEIFKSTHLTTQIVFPSEYTSKILHIHWKKAVSYMNIHVMQIDSTIHEILTLWHIWLSH